MDRIQSSFISFFVIDYRIMSSFKTWCFFVVLLIVFVIQDVTVNSFPLTDNESPDRADYERSIRQRLDDIRLFSDSMNAPAKVMSDETAEADTEREERIWGKLPKYAKKLWDSFVNFIRERKGHY